MANGLRPTSRALWAGVAIAGVVLLSACAGGNGSGESDSGGVSDEEFAEGGGDGTTAREANPEAALADASSGDTAGGQPAPEVDLLLDRDLIKTGSISLESDDIDQVLVDLDGIVTAQRGIVESEDTRTDDAGDVKSAAVVLRIPVDRFETAVDAITGLGVLIHEETSTEDVTTKVADVDARVESAQRSIDQLRLLFSQATELGDIIRLESELSERQADLESLQAQQRSLARQTALSTIHVSITRPEAAPKPADDGDQAGFVDGITSGWSGLVTFVRGTAHVVGLVLPLGTLALIVAAPIWLGVRRVKRGGLAQ
jgi:hypothetical protein